jgi:hypothetical protein
LLAAIDEKSKGKFEPTIVGRIFNYGPCRIAIGLIFYSFIARRFRRSTRLNPDDADFTRRAETASQLTASQG